MQLDYSCVDCPKFRKAPASAVLPVAKNATKVKINNTYRFVVSNK